ncbi:uncharacterized protein LOC117145401 [Drosophila mauritiana]|uniref:Uncharacterized protein LOC117145401 n=1 Tax=Drosophila mauritiana TaxID=7226 RepID=A0A6P8KCQ6_DROMA|nr:uncharacterized protein LOC117145401 [Drosophila mauritiana]
MIVISVAVVVAAFLGGLRRSSCQTQRRLSIVHMECHQIALRTPQPAPHARRSASTIHSFNWISKDNRERTDKWHPKYWQSSIEEPIKPQKPITISVTIYTTINERKPIYNFIIFSHTYKGGERAGARILLTKWPSASGRDAIRVRKDDE